MEREIVKLEALGILFIFLAGAVLHFVYEWSGKSDIVALFAPINESVWEHLKMVLWPAIVYAAFEYSRIGSSVNNFWIGKTLGIYTSIVTIIVGFYFYTYFLGHNLLIIDILLFLAAVALGHLVSYKIMVSPAMPSIYSVISIFLLLMLILSFTLFTYSPPHLPPFENPIDGTYGI